jgi:hypothetical protein
MTKVSVESASTATVHRNRKALPAGSYLDPGTGQPVLPIIDPPATFICRICRMEVPFDYYRCSRCSHLLHNDKQDFFFSDYPLLSVGDNAESPMLLPIFRPELRGSGRQSLLKEPRISIARLQWVMDGLPCLAAQSLMLP